MDFYGIFDLVLILTFWQPRIRKTKLMRSFIDVYIKNEIKKLLRF